MATKTALGSWRCACGAVVDARARACSECGTIRPATPPAGRVCWFDGGELDSLGFCQRAGGYPWPVPCPFVCPLCRGPLSWNGGCDRCKGSATPWDRRTWTFPGDYYEPVDKGPSYGHHVRVYKGPTPAPRPEQVAGYLAELYAELERIASAESPPSRPRRRSTGAAE